MKGSLPHAQWSGKTDGTPWMQRTLISWLRVVDVRVLYAVMAAVIPFYMIFAHAAYVACYRFFRRRLGLSPVSAFARVYVSQYHLGQVVLDRFAAYAGRRFAVDIDHYELFQQLAAAPGGFMQVSAHVGNYELAGYTLVAREKRFNALVFAGESEAVMAGRDRVFAAHNIRMIPVGDDMSHIFTLSAALRDGEIVSMPGDRVFGSQKVVTCRFFGAPARFPIGPFALAIGRGVPVLMVSVMKVATWRYRIFIDRIDAGISGSPSSPHLTPSAPREATSVQQGSQSRGRQHQELIEALAQRFATRLEEIVRQYPTQWYNYYDFWKQ